MGGILSTLNNSYTGLQTHQAMTDVTSHNISNANNAYYSRQRVDAAAKTPLLIGSNVIGQGAKVITIERVFDDFLFSRLKDASMDKQFSQMQQETLNSISTLYPEIDNVGIFNDIKTFFDSWQELASSGDDPALKQTLATNTMTLAQNIRDLRSRLVQMQKSIYADMKVLINEVNRLGSEIAAINKQINLYEQELMQVPANDLRDRRDELEMALNDLIGAEVFKKNLKSNSVIDNHIADFDENYTMLIGGATIVDGINFHPISINEYENANGFFDIFYEKKDGTRTDITDRITDGKIGAMLDLARGRIDDNDQVCYNYGKIQGYIDDLDTFAAGFIESVNNIYAHSAQQEMTSNVLKIDGSDFVVGSYLNIKEGSFDLKMYNSEGDEIVSKTVTITRNTKMEDIVAQINANTDDNKDLNGLNDFDDYFEASYDSQTGLFQIIPKPLGSGLSFAVSDNGTNFAGAIGLSRFLEGRDGRDFNLAERFRIAPTQITSYMAPAEGDIVVANMMQQLQYNKVEFHHKNGTVSIETISEFFKMAAAKVGSDAKQASTLLDTRTSVYNSIKLEFSSVSEVNIDEELTNLMRFQTGYTANAKVIATIDQMINTLLGIKQ